MDEDEGRVLLLLLRAGPVPVGEVHGPAAPEAQAAEEEVADDLVDQAVRGEVDEERAVLVLDGVQRVPHHGRGPLARAPGRQRVPGGLLDGGHAPRHGAALLAGEDLCGMEWKGGVDSVGRSVDRHPPVGIQSINQSTNKPIDRAKVSHLLRLLGEEHPGHERLQVLAAELLEGRVHEPARDHRLCVVVRVDGC